MKKHIKIKVKTLVLICLLAGLVLFSESLYWQGIKYYNQWMPEKYHIALNQINTRTLKSENARLSLIFSENNYDLFMLVTIEEGYTVDGMRLSRHDAENIYQTFLKYQARYDLYQDAPDYAINVALSQWFSGNTQRAFEIMAGFDPHTINEDVHLIEAGMALGLYEFERVLESLGQIASADYLEVKQNIYYLMKEVMALPYELPEVDGFKPRYFYGNLSQFKVPYSHLFSNIFRLNNGHYNGHTFMQNAEAQLISHTVSGQVTINDLPVHGAFVYEKRHRGMSSAGYGNYPLIVTDKNGYYHIPQTHDDLRGIGIAISWHLIHDKQKTSTHYQYADLFTDTTYDFNFHDGVRLKSLTLVDETLYYEFEDPLFSDHRHYRLIVRHTDPKYSFNSTAGAAIDWPKGQVSLEELRLYSQFSYGNIGPLDTLEIEMLIEPLYLSDTFAFTVSPYYIENDNRYIMNSFFSDFLTQSLFVAGLDAPSQGDVYLVDGKTEEAIAWYENNPSVHAFNVLIAMHKNDEEKIPKAIEYLKALMDTYGERDEYWTQMAHFYREIRAFDEMAAIYHQLIETDPLSTFYREQYALAMIYSGQFTEGIDYLTHNKQSFYWHSQFFILGNITPPFDNAFSSLLEAIEGVDAYHPFHTYIRKGAYEEAQSWLIQQPDNELKQMYTLVFRDAFRHLDPAYDWDTFYNDYIMQTNQMTNSKVASILRELKRYHNWF